MNLGRDITFRLPLKTRLVDSHRRCCLLSCVHATFPMLPELSSRNTNHILFLSFLKNLVKVLHYLISNCFTHQVFCSLCVIVYFSVVLLLCSALIFGKHLPTKFFSSFKIQVKCLLWDFLTHLNTVTLFFLCFSSLTDLDFISKCYSCYIIVNVCFPS